MLADAFREGRLTAEAGALGASPRRHRRSTWPRRCWRWPVLKAAMEATEAF